MPFAFPSHQGLIAPIWRRWPAAFDIPALFVGAAMPDVIDGLSAIGRGHFGQDIGHSLVGLPFLCVPVGLAIWFLLHFGARLLGRVNASGFLARLWNLGIASMQAGIKPAQFLRNWWRVVWCLAAGTASHLLVDLVSHGGFPWLLPWVSKLPIYPTWWYVPWVRVSIPGLLSRNVALHNAIWLVFSAVGIYLLFRPAFRKPQPEAVVAERNRERDS